MGRVRIRDLPLDRVRRRPELRYVTGQGRGGGARRGPGAPRDMARDRVRREVGAAIRDCQWSRPRWGDVLGRGRDVPHRAGMESRCKHIHPALSQGQRVERPMMSVSQPCRLHAAP